METDANVFVLISQHPNSVRWTEGLHRCADKMWPYVTEAVNKEAAVQLPDLIKASKPTWMGAIDLHK